MKLTALILLASLMQVSATAYSQATKFNFKAENKQVVEVLKEIEELSNFRFFYIREQVDVERRVTVKARGATVEQILDEMFSAQGVGYKVMDDNLVLLSPDKNIREIEAVSAQQKAVTGKVTDAGGQPLPGVTVVIKGTTQGTVTNVDGEYTIPNIPDNAVLQFSFVGMRSQEVVVGNQTTINIVLKDDFIGIEEVVAVGYGTQSRKSATGSTANVNAQDLNTVNAVSIDNLLQGKAAGLNITNNTAQPGGGVSVNIRGRLSPNGSNSPLYVIDGVPITDNGRVDNMGSSLNDFVGGTDRNPLNTINPNDIESVDILKDASAAAIYGSAAANGVILITTKRGKEQKTTVTYSGTYSIQTPKKWLEPLNSTEFMENHELFAQEYWRYTNKVAPYGNVDPSTASPYSPFFSASDIAKAANGANNNWADYMLQTGMISDQNISISGGTQNTKVYTSFNYFDQSSVLKNSDMSRFSGRLNLDQKLGSRLLLKLGLNYSQVKNQNQNTGYAYEPGASNIIQSAMKFTPNFEVYDANGNLTKSYATRIPNPQAWLMINNSTTTTRLFFTPSLDFKISNELKATITSGIDESRAQNDFFIPKAAGFLSIPDAYAQLGTNFTGNYSSEGYFSYDKKFEKSRLSVVAGAGYYKTINNGYSLQAYGFFTDAFGSAAVQIAENKDKNSIYSWKRERTKISQFARVNYTLLDKYILTFNGRYDGSSIWAEGQKWGFFPGLSGAWLINEENFMKSVPEISQLKLRVGYGTVGNEGLGGNYSLSTYGTSGGFSYPFGGKLSNGVLQTQLGNPLLHWEKDITINTGLDFGFFKNRISGSVDYFVRTAKDLFNFRNSPSNNAIGRIGANVGSTASKGIEIMIETQNINSKTFSWTTNITFNSYKSYWKERSNPEDLAITPWVGKNDEISAVYGWKTNGLIRSVDEIPEYQSGAYVGNIKYIDVNKDGRLDGKDVQYLGNTDPRAFYGIGNTFTYKGFDLNVFIYGSLGGLQADSWQTVGNLGNAISIYNSSAPANIERHGLNTWSSFNPNGTYPGMAPDVVGDAQNPTAGRLNSMNKVSDYGMRKVNWGRLKNLTLGYNLPSGLLQKQKICQSVRIFIDMQNLAVFGNYSGLDPEMEVGVYYPYPISQTTAFGLNVKF